MYIPSAFFSSQAANLLLSASIATGSQFPGVVDTILPFSTGSFTSGSQTWNFLYFSQLQGGNSAKQFPNSGSITIFSGSTHQANIVIIGGGGGAGVETTLNRPAAGGGGGGIVRYSNFPLVPGTYEIVVGGGGVITNATTGSGTNGQNSYIKLPNNQIYSPFTSSYLIAFGGGGGAGLEASTGTQGKRGGSNGGNVAGFSSPLVPSSSTLGVGLGGLNGLNQGNVQGSIPAVLTLPTRFRYASTGGGGAVSASISAYYIDGSNFDFITPGGDGLELLLYKWKFRDDSSEIIVLDSSSQYYSGGGGSWGSVNGSTFSSSLYGLGGYSTNNTNIGAGGQGNGDVTNVSDTNGSSGLIYIEYPVYPEIS